MVKPETPEGGTPQSLSEALAVGIYTAPAGQTISALLHIQTILVDFLAQRFQVANLKAKNANEEKLIRDLYESITKDVKNEK